MIRLTALALLTGLLAACNSGDSFLEWDPETQAILDAQAAEAEAAEARGQMTDEEILAQAEAGTMAEPDAAPAAAPAGGLQAPLVLLDAQGGIMQGMLVRDPGSSQVQVVWADGAQCSGGLVRESGEGDAASIGTFALNCSDGTIWLGKYADAMPGQGAWSMRSAGGTQARAVYGSDVPAEGLDAGAFEGVWASRSPAPPPA